MSAERHYEDLLARVYSWMGGGFEAGLERSRAFFERHRIGPGMGGAALDVGCGSGFQSIALAERGFRVTAVDPSATLFAELRGEAAARRLEVDAVEDAVPLGDRHLGPFELVACMGDTLATLPTAELARTLIAEAAVRLAPGGILLLTWRDLTRLPDGDARFIPVRSTADRVFTCFLEAIDDSRVRVHDILHEREGDGVAQRVSSYLELRLSPETVDRWLLDSGFETTVREDGPGLVTRIGRRRA